MNTKELSLGFTTTNDTLIVDGDKHKTTIQKKSIDFIEFEGPDKDKAYGFGGGILFVGYASYHLVEVMGQPEYIYGIAVLIVITLISMCYNSLLSRIKAQVNGGDIVLFEGVSSKTKTVYSSLQEWMSKTDQQQL